MIAALRTDGPTVELLLINRDGMTVERLEWLAERRLARELPGTLEEFLNRNNTSWQQLSGLVVFKGPGSFTGLRIGITVMNTLAYGLNIPIVGEAGDKWYKRGVQRLLAREDDRIVLPEYGAPARITIPRK